MKNIISKTSSIIGTVSDNIASVIAGAFITPSAGGRRREVAANAGKDEMFRRYYIG